jgi:hypothetical protein
MPTSSKVVLLDVTTPRVSSFLAASSIAKLLELVSTHRPTPTNALHVTEVSTPTILRPHRVTFALLEHSVVVKLLHRAFLVLLASTNPSTVSSLACNVVLFDTVGPEATQSSTVHPVMRSFVRWLAWRSQLCGQVTHLRQSLLQCHPMHHQQHPQRNRLVRHLCLRPDHLRRLRAFLHQRILLPERQPFLRQLPRRRMIQ